MTDRTVPKLPKWPFLLGDALLLTVGAWIILRSEAPVGVWSALSCLGAVALGAWICIIPFLREHQTALKLAEADALTDAVAQIQNLEVVKTHITDATGLWSAIQNQAELTVQNAREVSERTAEQLREFHTFFEKANDQEKNTLRLETDKLKRAEADWLQVLVRILDFVYALHQAGQRTGQTELIRELTQFQNACRDAARRVGLVPFAPSASDAFDSRLHQTPEAENSPENGTPVTQALAPGYTFQTQLLRRALVRVSLPTETGSSESESATEPSPDTGCPSPSTASVQPSQGERQDEISF